MQEEDQEGSPGANTDSDAEFEQMLAEAEEPKPATSNTEESTQQKEDDPNVPVNTIKSSNCNVYTICYYTLTSKTFYAATTKEKS